MRRTTQCVESTSAPILPVTLARSFSVILAVCLFGILGVGYGMMNKDHLVFIAGLVFVVAGYLMIRKELKEYIRKKYHSEDDRGRTPGP
jgi:inner membrane protein involved in colicin E2 resistance